MGGESFLSSSLVDALEEKAFSPQGQNQLKKEDQEEKKHHAQNRPNSTAHHFSSN